MIEPQYLYFVSIGFWFMLGLIQGLIVGALVYKAVSALLDILFITETKRLNKQLFTALPSHIKGMHLNYCKKSKILTASCEVTCLRSMSKSRYVSIYVPSKDVLEDVAAEAQLRLMANISKEINDVKTN